MRKLLVAASLLLLAGHSQADSLEDRVGVYRACIELVIPQLDDRTADPATVATGVHARCIEYFEAIHQMPNTVGRSEWAAILKPRVIESILAHRATRRAPPPAKPRHM